MYNGAFRSLGTNGKKMRRTNIKYKYGLHIIVIKKKVSDRCTQ